MDTMLHVHAASDPGRKRSRNEDCHAVWMSDDAAERARRGVLLVIADGMGGTLAGDVASRMAVDAVLRCFGNEDGGDPLACLRASVEAANHDVHAASLTRANWHGMGTTCTALLVRGREVWIAHVGDSRAYLVRDGNSHQLTEDHSLVAALVRRREITADQARADSRRNLVTRCIGPSENVEVDAGRVDGALEPGDTLLLCSDGLYGLVEDREIVALISNPSLEKACRDLIDLANRRGGPDNITVVVARLEGPDAAGATAPPPARASQLGPHESVAPRPTAPESVAARSAGPTPAPRSAAPQPAGPRRGESPSPVVYLLVLLALAVALLALVWWMGRGSR